MPETQSPQQTAPFWQQTAEQQIEQAREIAEIRNDVQHILQAVSEMNAKLQLLFTLSKDVAAMDQRLSDLRDATHRAHERINAVESVANNTRDSTSAWVNRGIGAWVVGAILVGVLQALLVDRVKTYELSQASNTSRLDAVDKRILWLEYAGKNLPAPQAPAHKPEIEQ